MKKLSLIGIGLLAMVSVASANDMQAESGTPSRALQQARRVASMENDQDLPSRAMKLGKRVAKNFKVAYQTKPGKQPAKKNTTSEN